MSLFHKTVYAAIHNNIISAQDSYSQNKSIYIQEVSCTMVW